jgi:hypothetical protein
VNLDWMTTGPQANFWPSQVHTGQAYSENTPMRIQVRRGLVGEGRGYGPRRMLAPSAIRSAQSVIRVDDWNEYTSSPAVPSSSTSSTASRWRS